MRKRNTEVIDPGGGSATTVRIPRYYLRALKRLNRLVIQQGMLHLPPQLQEVLKGMMCPLCDQEMHKENGYLVCRCGLAKALNAADSMTASHMVGYASIAFAILARTQENVKKPARSRTNIRKRA